MKISQVLISSGFGGAERLFVDICNGMAKRGHKILAICPGNFQGISLLDVTPDICIEAVNSHWDRNPFAEMKLRRVIASFKSEVVHTHLARTASLTGAALKGEPLPVPVVANIHNYIKLKYYKHIDHFVPGTEHQASYLESSGVPVNGITVIPHFTNIQNALPSQHDFSIPKLAAFGRFVHEKGFDVLIKAIHFLRQKGVDIEVFLGGSGVKFESLKKLCSDLCIENLVHFCGWVEDVETFLKKAPFFVLPSRNESFGIVVLEAMARGNCIISTRTRGPLEILCEKSAFLCDIDDHEDMARAILNATQNPDSARKRADFSHEVFSQKYSADIVLGQYERLFLKLVYDKLSQRRRGNLAPGLAKH